MIGTTTYRQRLKARLAITLRDKSAAAIAERIEEERQARHRLLLRRAHEWRITAEPDITPNQYITRMGKDAPNPGPGGGGYKKINLTSRARCTCREFSIWNRCPCQAFVIEMEQSSSIIMLRYGVELEAA